MNECKIIKNNINCIVSGDVFTGLYYAYLLGGEFNNCYGQGNTSNESIISLKIRVNQLQNKKNKK